ncbi:MAG: hypothetical protein LBS55_08775 [Prevotellaceae bacterium]|jgi:hypothetical protein|nr:hypothetical protein [Prevotellaceae bacterium]
MFIGYLSSFFIAVLLSVFCLSYAAFDTFKQINKEVKNDSNTEIREKSSDIVVIDNVFVVDYYLSDVPEKNRQIILSGCDIGIPIMDDDIPIQKNCLSEYFLRPPPAL